MGCRLQNQGYIHWFPQIADAVNEAQSMFEKNPNLSRVNIIDNYKKMVNEEEYDKTILEDLLAFDDPDIFAH